MSNAFYDKWQLDQKAPDWTRIEPKDSVGGLWTHVDTRSLEESLEYARKIAALINEYGLPTSLDISLGNDRIAIILWADEDSTITDAHYQVANAFTVYKHGRV